MTGYHAVTARLVTARQKVLACTECAQVPRLDFRGQLVPGDDGQPVTEGSGKVFPAAPAPLCAMCGGTGRDPMHTDGGMWRTGRGELVSETEPPGYQAPALAVYAPDPPATAQQAARDAYLNQAERHHGTALAERREAEQKAQAEAVAGFIVARQHAVQQ